MLEGGLTDPDRKDKPPHVERKLLPCVVRDVARRRRRTIEPGLHLVLIVLALKHACRNEVSWAAALRRRKEDAPIDFSS